MLAFGSPPWTPTPGHPRPPPAPPCRSARRAPLRQGIPGGRGALLGATLSGCCAGTGLLALRAQFGIDHRPRSPAAQSAGLHGQGARHVGMRWGLREGAQLRGMVAAGPVFIVAGAGDARRSPVLGGSRSLGRATLATTVVLRQRPRRLVARRVRRSAPWRGARAAQISECREPAAATRGRLKQS